MKTGIYEHYKGGRYEVMGLAQHSETLERLVVYRAISGHREFWVRPIDIFQEKVEVRGKRVPRFRFIKQ